MEAWGAGAAVLETLEASVIASEKPKSSGRQLQSRGDNRVGDHHSTVVG